MTIKIKAKFIFKSTNHFGNQIKPVESRIEHEEANPFKKIQQTEEI